MVKKSTCEEFEKEGYNRRPGEEKLIHSHDLMDYIISNALSAIAVYDRDLKYIYVSKRFLKDYKVKEKNVIGKHHYEIFPDTPQKWKDVHQRSLSGEVISAEEDPYYRDDGTINWTRWECRPWYESKGSIGGIIIYNEIINERKKTEEALKKSEIQLLTIIEHSNELFYIHDVNQVFTYVSLTSEDILGYTPEEMNIKWEDFTTQNPINFKGAAIKGKAIKTGKKQKPYLIELRKKDGELILVEIDESPVKDSVGKVVAIAGAARDVTLKKQTDDRLIKSEQRFRDLFDGISDIIYIHDFKGRLISVNPAMCKAFGYELDELIGRRITDFMKLGVVSDFEHDYMEPLKKNEFQEGSAIYFKKNGEKLYIEYKSALVQPENAEPFISGIGRDITERILSEGKVVKLQEQVIQSQKMESIGTLAGGIAHDFNNILFPILGHTEMLLDDSPEGSSSRGSLKEIYSATLRAKDLVKQILTFSRQETSKLKLIKMQFVVREALKLIRSTIPTTIEIKQDINDDCGVIKADPTQIHQIVMNLATNAYHAMEETGGELKVSLKEKQFGKLDLINPNMTPGVYVCLIVADTGMGMDKNLTGKIFDPFFTTKATGKGTGLGLSVVHGIVSSMGGAIQVYSEPYKGTKFHVYFPIEKKSFKIKSTLAEEPIQGGVEKILLVDDEKAILNMEKQMLERLGYNVTSHVKSLEALKAFQNNPDKFDLVITDMAMPDMPGDRLSAELIKIRPGIPVLLCTGFSENMSEKKAASLGIKGFLLKPIAINNFAQKIREVLYTAQG